MKRKKSNKSTKKTTSSDLEPSDSNSLSSKFSRNNLINFIEVANNLLSSECSQVVSQIPVEIWKAIVVLVPSYEPKVKLFSKLACVVKSWLTIIHELVRLNFAKYKPSNWVLSICDHVEELSLNETSSIVNTTLARLTNLKALNLSKCNNKITPDGFKGLTNLTSFSLKFGWFPGFTISIEDYLKEGVNKLTNLSSLVFGSLGFTEPLMPDLVNLSTLTITSRSLILCYSNLPNFNNLLSLTIDRDSWVQANDISCLRNLTSLFLDNAESGLDGLEKLKNLSTLSLSKCTPVSGKHIKTLISLTSLSINQENKGESKRCKKSNLDIGNLGVKDLTNLTFLDLGYNNQISNQGVTKLIHLKSLLNGGSSIKKNELKFLTNLTKLS
jgi:hypothetical protein